MSLSAAGAGSNSALYFVAILLIIVLVRMRRIINGTRVSVARTLGFSAYYIIFGGLVLSGSFFLPIPVDYFIAYPIVAVIAFLLAFEFARRRIIFWKTSDGAIYQKGGVPIYLIYIVGLIARIAIGYLYIGPNFLFYIPTSTLTLSSTAISATIATDLLLLFGVGLLFGRNMRILKKYLAIKSGKETLEPEREEAGSTPSVPT